MMCSNSSGLFLVDKAKLHGSCKQNRNMIFQPVSLSRYMRFVCLIVRNNLWIIIKIARVKHVYIQRKKHLYLDLYSIVRFEIMLRLRVQIFTSFW